MKNLILALLLALLPGLAAARDMALVDPPAIVFPVGISQSSVVAAIKLGLAYRQWVIQTERPGFIEATVRANGDVSATVDISYDAGHIEIKYAASHNMHVNEQGGERHISSRYINWSRNLAQSITEGLLKESGPK